MGSPLFLWSGYYQSIKTKGQSQRQSSLDDLEIDGGSPPDNDFSELAQFYPEYRKYIGLGSLGTNPNLL